MPKDPNAQSCIGLDCDFDLTTSQARSRSQTLSCERLQEIPMIGVQSMNDPLSRQGPKGSRRSHKEIGLLANVP